MRGAKRGAEKKKELLVLGEKALYMSCEHNGLTEALRLGRRYPRGPNYDTEDSALWFECDKEVEKGEDGEEYRCKQVPVHVQLA